MINNFFMVANFSKVLSSDISTSNTRLSVLQCLLQFKLLQLELFRTFERFQNRN